VRWLRCDDRTGGERCSAIHTTGVLLLLIACSDWLMPPLLCVTRCCVIIPRTCAASGAQMLMLSAPMLPPRCLL
jgi:hypothetical protein